MDRIWLKLYTEVELSGRKTLNRYGPVVSAILHKFERIYRKTVKPLRCNDSTVFSGFLK